MPPAVFSSRIELAPITPREPAPDTPEPHPRAMSALAVVDSHPRTPPRWLRRLALGAGAWLAAQAALGGPGLVTSSALLNETLQVLVLLLAAGVGLWWAATARRAPRLARLVVGVPAIPLAPLSILSLLFLVTCGPAAGTRYGESADLQRVNALTLPTGGEVVVYRDDTGGPTVAFRIAIRQERPLGAGVRVSRSVYGRYRASNAALAVDARSELVIRTDDGAVARRRLRRFVYF